MLKLVFLKKCKMIYYCVICMVDTSQRPSVMLDRDRRRLWETMISPLVNIVELEKISVGTCTDCFKLLNSMISFQKTMVAGANRLLKLQAQVKPKHTPIIFRKANCYSLPTMMLAQPVADRVLPVVNEEIVCSTGTWLEDEIVAPATVYVSPIGKKRAMGLSGTVFHNIEPSAPVTVNLSGAVIHGAVGIADCNDDYAVLVPFKENSINLLCEEEVSYSSEYAGKFEEAMLTENAKEEDVKACTNVSETSVVGKQKLNRQLYEALRATIQTPIVRKKFDSRYEPESDSVLEHEKRNEFSHKAKDEREHRSLYKSEHKLKDESCHNPNESMPKLSHEAHESTHVFVHELKLDSGRMSRDQLIHETKHELGHISWPDWEHESSHESGHQLKDESFHNSNEPVHKSSYELHNSTNDFGHELTHNSGRMSKDESRQIWRDKLINEIKHDFGHIPWPESEHESSHESGHQLKDESSHNSNEPVHKLSHESHKSTNDFGHELTHNSGCISRDESAHIWRDKLINEITHKLGHISNEWEHESSHVSGHKLKDASRHKWSDESTHKSVHEPTHIPEHESRHVSGHVLKDKSRHKLKHVSGHVLKDGSGLKSRHVSGHELEDVSGHELKDESGHESAHDSGHGMRCESPNDYESSSTLSCDSDYDNPELYPNIIFAQSFNKVSEDVHLHSHIVRNPPSEWPCAGERCRLQDSCSDEDEIEELPPISDQVQNGCIREHSSESVFQCDVRRDACADEAELRPHKTNHRLQSAEPAWHSCAACGAHFRRAAALLKHRDTPKHAAHAVWRFECDICKRKCPDKEKLREHLEREHLAKNRMKCPMCPAVFTSARSLGRHAAAHILTPTGINTHAHTNNTSKELNIHEIINETHANGLKKRTYRRTNKRKLKTKKIANTNMHIDTYVDGEGIVKINKQASKRKLTTKKIANTNMHIETYVDGEDIIKINKQASKRKLRTKKIANTNMHIDTYVDEEGIIKINKQVSKRKLRTKKIANTNMHIDTCVEGEDIIKSNKQASKRKPKNGERDMYMNVLTYEQGNTDMYEHGRNVYTVLHPNGHDYTTKLQETYNNGSKQTNRQPSNGRIKKRARKARTRKRARTRAPQASLEPVLPVITNVVSLFDT